jgi:hypothetical protein
MKGDLKKGKCKLCQQQLSHTPRAGENDFLHRYIIGAFFRCTAKLNGQVFVLYAETHQSLLN